VVGLAFPASLHLFQHRRGGALTPEKDRPMIVNPQVLDLAYRGFKTVVTDAMMEAKTYADQIAMTVPSASRDETYGWLGAFPSMREWLGPRNVQNLVANGFTITNRKFEATLEVTRDEISDDRLGIFKPMFAEMGQAARRHPEELVFGLLASGFTSLCYDGQFFFDVDHPVTDAAGAVTQVSNFQGGAGTPWYLLDTSRQVRPIIWQEREKYEFQQLTQENSEYVFLNDRYLYGIRARVNAGFGLWQLAYGSRQTLNAANYAAARAAMMGFTADGGRKLGISPTILLVPPSLEEAGLNLLNTEFGAAGASNPWKDTAKLIVTPYL
jgi:phage major head subunit gpT-like protein